MPWRLSYCCNKYIILLEGGKTQSSKICCCLSPLPGKDPAIGPGVVAWDRRVGRERVVGGTRFSGLVCLGWLWFVEFIPQESVTSQERS